jgi:hypothetical protein
MIAAEPFMLVFRFLHIVTGVAWVGSAFLFVGFIGPSAAEVGPSALPLLTAAVKKRADRLEQSRPTPIAIVRKLPGMPARLATASDPRR